jgi:hypothetical protein
MHDDKIDYFAILATPEGVWGLCDCVT